MAQEWIAKQTEVKFALASAITVATNTALDSLFSGSAVSAVVKDLTVTPPEGSVEKSDFIGKDTNGFQNALLTEKPFGEAKMSGTMILDHDEVLDQFFMGSGTTVTSGTYTWTRYQAGTTTSGKTRLPIAALTNLSDGATDEVNILLHNACLTKLGDKKLGGADGKWEVDFEITCLPKDYYEEYEN